MLSDQDDGKSQLKTINLFWVWFHCVCSRLRIVEDSDDEEPADPARLVRGTRLMLELHPRLFNSYEALQGTEWQHIAPCHLWPPLSVWNQWHCRRLRPDQTGGATARGSWLNLERTILACWQIRRKHSCRNTEGYNGLQPTALGSIEAFSFGLSCPALAHPAFFSVSCSHFIL